VIVVAMFGFGYALVPFYEKICEATGLRNIAQADTGERTRRSTTTRAVRSSSTPTIRKLPWTFRALSPVVSVHPGS
jgi:cytochrome c oxidase assembly protein subunit 11